MYVVAIVMMIMCLPLLRVTLRGAIVRTTSVDWSSSEGLCLDAQNNSQARARE